MIRKWKSEEKMIEQTVENIARMDIQERDTFVKTLVTKWPDLAISVNNMITLEQMVQDKLYEKHLNEQAEAFEIQRAAENGTKLY
tara:strand:- start:269 stop:523 length:255 start_codon:yes stop_codon:yes gene_type:complete